MLRPGESLRRRLPRHPELAQELLSRAVDPWEQRDMGGKASPADEVGDLLSVDVTSQAQRAMLDWLLCGRSGPLSNAETSMTATASGARWGPPKQSEIAVHVPSTSSGGLYNRANTTSLCSRSYIQQVAAGRETRLATVCVADDS